MICSYYTSSYYVQDNACKNLNKFIRDSTHHVGYVHFKHPINIEPRLI